MKKKLLVLLGASALVLTACGGSTDGTAKTNGDNQDLVTNTTDATGAVGSDIDLGNGVVIKLSDPQHFAPTQFASNYVKGQTANLFEATVTNNGSKAVDWATVSFVSTTTNAASLYVLWNREILPLWVVLVLIGRDFILLIVNLLLQQKKLSLLTVNYVGKAATFNLLYAFPLLFLSQTSGWVGTLGYIFGWAFSAWGVALYVITGIGYLVSGWKSIRFPNGLIAG